MDVDEQVASNDDRAFLVLDEVCQSDDDGDVYNNSGDNDDDLSDDETLSDDDIDNMLEDAHPQPLLPHVPFMGQESQNHPACQPTPRGTVNLVSIAHPQPLLPHVPFMGQESQNHPACQPTPRGTLNLVSIAHPQPLLPHVPFMGQESQKHPACQPTPRGTLNLVSIGYKEGVERASKRQKVSQDPKNESQQAGDYVQKTKLVMIEKSPDHFEVLPNGWIAITHASGVNVYLHRATRVCTFSKPYFLGSGSCRKHRIPLSAVPCLDYLRATEQEKQKQQSPHIVINGQSVPQAKVLSSEETIREREISIEEMSEYCKRRFEFKEIDVFRYNTWQIRRKENKRRRFEQRPTLPHGGKLITCPILQTKNDLKPKEWVMNPNGKTYVCILHDYVQRGLKETPVYTYKEIENTATPYLVSITINGIEYGKGVGSSKKLAKLEAAKATLEILIPGMKDKIAENPKMAGRTGEKVEDNELKFFDDIKITDPRIMEFCQKTTEPTPHAILLTCLQRNFGLNEMNITYEMKPTVKHTVSEYTMTVGPNSATVQCQNKRDGKQKASQHLLQQLHPYISSWGSLLRMYGSSSIKTFKEKKAEEKEITALQSKGVTHGPNQAILDKLSKELTKLAAAREAIKPIGVFIPPADVKMPSASLSELYNVNL